VTLLLTVALPLVSAFVTILFGRWLGRRLVALVAVVPLALAFGSAVAIAQAFIAGKTSLVADLGPWLPLHGADLLLRVEGPAVALLVAVTGIATLIAIAGVAALEASSRRTFVALDLLVTGTCLIVSTPDMILILAGAELVAAASYLLVSARSEGPAAAGAAVRAFTVARIGDAALLVAVVALFATFRTLDLGEIAQRVGGFTGQPEAVARLQSALFVPSLLVVAAALARASALPFPTWLADARHAPAPASAALQAWAAAAGPLILMRLGPILHPATLDAAVALGILTAVYAAIVALAQRDARESIAWSSASGAGLALAAAGARADGPVLLLVLALAASRPGLVLAAGAQPGRIRSTAVALAALSACAIPVTAGSVAVASLAGALETRPIALVTALAAVALGSAATMRVAVGLIRRPAAPGGSRSLLGGGLLLVFGVLAVAIDGPLSTALHPLGTLVAVAGATFGIALAVRRSVTPPWLARAASSAFELDRIYPLAIAAPFGSLAEVLARGSEGAIERGADLIGSSVVHASALARLARSRYVSADGAVAVAAIVALLAYWSLR
jgi:NADH-quinone oxidoreductase subunit L